MTKVANDTDSAKRAQLKSKIDAGAARNQARTLADTAKQAAGDAVGFAKRHPLMTVAGAVAVGLAIGAMTKPGRRAAKKGGVLAALATDAAIAYGLKFLDTAGDAAKSAGSTLGDFSESAGSSARDLAREAVARAGSAREAAVSAARDLRSRMTH